MMQWLVTLFILFGVEASIANAEEYLLRVEAAGFIDQPGSVPDPVPMLFHSVEVIARPDVPFHSKVRFGKESVVWSGRFEPAQDGRLRVSLKYHHSIDTGDTVVNENNQRVPLLHETSLRTTVEVILGESQTVGSTVTARQTIGKPAVKSQTKYVLTVSKPDRPAN